MPFTGPSRLVSGSMTGAGLLAGVIADRVVGEPRRWYPVAGFGAVAAALERRWWRPSRAAGVAYVTVLVGGVTAAGVLAERSLARRPTYREERPPISGPRRRGDMDTTSRATTTLLSLTCSHGWLAQGRALAADQTCWSGCWIVDCILPTSQPAMAGYCRRRLAGGCGFVVAVGYASVSPQAGTNLHSAAIPHGPHSRCWRTQHATAARPSLPNSDLPMPLMLDSGSRLP